MFAVDSTDLFRAVVEQWN